jgi:hypothetical protein
VADAASRPAWTAMAARLGARLDPTRQPHALAALVVKPG